MPKDRGPKNRDIVDEISKCFAEQGAASYIGEPVTVAEHMLQVAALARESGADETTVAAALLHDIGHLTGGIESEDDWHRNHDAVGARFLEGAFPKAVSEPVRLHVAAKRYLCAVDESYAARLSQASVHTLKLQGGPMSPAEREGFEAEPYHEAAVAIRLWDDAGKDPETRVPDFESYRALLEKLAR